MKYQDPVVKTLDVPICPHYLAHRKYCQAAIAVILLACVMPSHTRGERVGFAIEGTLSPPLAGSDSLFDKSVPGNTPIFGTFSYDSTVVGKPTVPPAAGAAAFRQEIAGSLNLIIKDKDGNNVRLSASDYIINVVNDTPRSPENVDLFIADYDTRPSPKPAPILVDGVPWTKTAFIKIELSWPWSTFTDPDEPKLTTDRPLTPQPGISALLGSSGAPRRFSIDSIAPIVPPEGDYNRDGAIDLNDYAEWRSSFGQEDPAGPPADGNRNLVVDAADYVIWRDALNSASSPALSPRQLPEPSAVNLVVAAAVGFATLMLRSFR